jgi:hypothetical protein
MDYVCQPKGGTLGAADDASRAAWFAPGDIVGLKITEGTPAVIAKGFAWLNQEEHPGDGF